MMRKFALIPIVSLGKDTKGMFLEVMSEPHWMGGADFKALELSGLNSEVEVAKNVLEALVHYQLPASHLYLGNHFFNLNNLSSISLGLTLAAYLQHKNCVYQKIIAIGKVDVETSALTISGGDYLKTQLKTILALEKQPVKVPLFLPAKVLPNNAYDLEKQLAQLNIELKPVVDLYEALSCLGINMSV